MHCFLCLFRISFLDKGYQWLFQMTFFHLGDKKSVRWSGQIGVALSYTVTIVQEFSWVDSALVVLNEWLSYRGGRLNKFSCNALS